jgi:energy-coupling factor transporter ATP-binding protein EcfA2
MRLSRVVIHRFRGVQHLSLDVEDDLTVLVGPNGVGKSTVLSAIQWFLDGKPLSDADVPSLGENSEPTIVRLEFVDPVDSDREALGSYVGSSPDARIALSRIGTRGEKSKLTGRAFGHPALLEIAGNKLSAADTKKLRDEAHTVGIHGLDGLTKKEDIVQAARNALTNPANFHHFEQMDDVPASHLLGATGDSAVRKCFDFLLVSADDNDGDGAVQRLLEIAIGDNDAAVEAMAHAQGQADALLQRAWNKNFGPIARSLSNKVQRRFRAIVGPAEFRVAPTEIGKARNQQGVTTSLTWRGHEGRPESHGHGTAKR